MSLQYLKKEVRDKVDFLHADKYKSFQQVDFNTLGIKASCKVTLSLLKGMIKHSRSTQSNKFAISLQYFKKEVRDVGQFLHPDKFLQVGINVFLWKWPGMLEVPKVLLLSFKTFRYFTGVQSCWFLLVSSKSSNYLFKISIGDFCACQDYQKSNICYFNQSRWPVHLKNF